MRTMITILLAAGLLQAQDKPAERVKPEPREAVIIPVKTLTGDSFDRLVGLLRVFKDQAQYSGDKDLRTIIVYAPKDVVEQMRKVVAELDRPGSEAATGRNIEMTMTFPQVFYQDQDPAAPAFACRTRSRRQATACGDAVQSIELWDVVPLRLQEGKDAEEHPAPALRRLASGDFRQRNDQSSPRMRLTRKDQGRSVRFGQPAHRV